MTHRSFASGKNDQNSPAIEAVSGSYGYTSSWGAVEEVVSVGFGDLARVPAVFNDKNRRFSFKMEHMPGVPVLRWSTRLAFPFASSRGWCGSHSCGRTRVNCIHISSSLSAVCFTGEDHWIQEGWWKPLKFGTRRLRNLQFKPTIG